MDLPFRIGILGAGLGSRLRMSAAAKPLAKMGPSTLLERLLGRFLAHGAQEIHCALRAELLSDETRATLPKRESQELTYLFVDTESSLHTLGELISSLGARKGPVLFSMADTIMQKDDFHNFLNFCRSLNPNENAVLLTKFVDDEKPLWVQLDGKGNVLKFGSEASGVVTSGMYFLQPAAMALALEEIAAGTHKMRNFLAKMCEQGFPIKSFVVDKTIDVDHPSDLKKAEEFLHGD